MKLSPSIIAADFSELRKYVKEAEESGVEMLHLDVMDGHFVPNITFGPALISSLRANSKLIFDTHLMISEPDKYLKEFAESGSDYITVHLESDGDTAKTLVNIRSLGKKAGLAIKPGTPVASIEPYIALCDLILIMSVEPGFTGQKYICGSEEKVIEARKIADKHNCPVLISVDGGVNAANISLLSRSGADAVVVGAAVFRQPDIKKAVAGLRAAANSDKQ